MMILLPGGSGHLGRILAAHFTALGHEVVVLTRGADGSKPGQPRRVHWDGQTLGAWTQELENADVVINLAGRSVDCRYHKRNLEEMLSSRIDTTRILGTAISAAQSPPATWLQMSTATLYAHCYDTVNDESSGVIGGFETGVPAYWRYSIHIAEAWERTLSEASLPRTRRVALRTAMVMSRERGGPFSTLKRLTRFGLGGSIAGGRQGVSWIHEDDFVHAVSFLIEHDEISGAVNLASPHPLPQRDFSAALRAACRAPIGLPTPEWMIHLGAALLRTDPELILKSRNVVPGRLVAAGFEFEFPRWPAAAHALVAPA